MTTLTYYNDTVFGDNLLGVVSIVIHDSVTEIRDESFMGLMHVTSIFIPNSVVTM